MLKDRCRSARLSDELLINLRLRSETRRRIAEDDQLTRRLMSAGRRAEIDRFNLAHNVSCRHRLSSRSASLLRAIALVAVWTLLLKISENLHAGCYDVTIR